MLDEGSSSLSTNEQNDSNDQEIAIQISKDDLLTLAHASSVTYDLVVPNESEEYLKGYEIIPFRDSSTHAGVILLKENEVIIAYRGTWNMRDVGTDTNIAYSIPPFLKLQIQALI